MRRTPFRWRHFRSNLYYYYFGFNLKKIFFRNSKVRRISAFFAPELLTEVNMGFSLVSVKASCIPFQSGDETKINHLHVILHKQSGEPYVGFCTCIVHLIAIDHLKLKKLKIHFNVFFSFFFTYIFYMFLRTLTVTFRNVHP